MFAIHYAFPFLGRAPSLPLGNYHFPDLYPHGVSELDLKPQNQNCTHNVNVANL